jgi:hypothetical protein
VSNIRPRKSTCKPFASTVADLGSEPHVADDVIAMEISPIPLYLFL